jgi:DNA-directed RNA polymerase specialized sigma24 family protein
MAFRYFSRVDTSHSYEDAMLQKQIAQGDQRAFKVLYDRHHGRLFQYVFKIVKSKEVAEELVMDVFMKLWIARDMMPQINNLDGFLFKVAYNKSIDFFRSAAKDKVFTDLLWEKIQVPAQAQADTSLLLHEYEKKLREAIVEARQFIRAYMDKNLDIVILMAILSSLSKNN